MSKKVFVISDTWFNRPTGENSSMEVEEYNNMIIEKWNKTVGKNDDIYVLGGFGISDLYSIVIKLNGTIHFLNNFHTEDELIFRDTLYSNVVNSIDKKLSNKIKFNDNQILALSDYDVILSYFPLSYWYGKDTGTMCFHGLTDDSDLKGGSITCFAQKINFKPLNIVDVANKLEEYSDSIYGINVPK